MRKRVCPFKDAHGTATKLVKNANLNTVSLSTLLNASKKHLSVALPGMVSIFFFFLHKDVNNLVQFQECFMSNITALKNDYEKQEILRFGKSRSSRLTLSSEFLLRYKEWLFIKSLWLFLKKFFLLKYVFDFFLLNYKDFVKQVLFHISFDSGP